MIARRPPPVGIHRAIYIGATLGLFVAYLLPRPLAIAWVLASACVIVVNVHLVYRKTTFQRTVELRASPTRARRLVEEIVRSVLGAAGTGPQAEDVFRISAWRPQFGWTHDLEFRIEPWWSGSRVHITSGPMVASSFEYNPKGVRQRWDDLDALVAALERSNINGAY
jgi:hypothetical protein